MARTSGGSRIFAAIIVLAGVALLAWAGLRGASDSVAEPGPATAESASTTDSTSSSGSESTTEGTATTGGTATTEQAPAATATPLTPAPAAAPTVELENYGPRRQLVNLDGWLNTDITSLDDLDGKVVLVEMWTFGCHNCKARIPYNQSFYEKYDREEFEIVGVHAPEFSYEADVANIEQALVDLGVTWPVALDTSKKNFRVWQEGTTNYWPRTYLIDQNGDIRFDHIGEGKYTQLEDAIDALLTNPPAANG